MNKQQGTHGRSISAERAHCKLEDLGKACDSLSTSKEQNNCWDFMYINMVQTAIDSIQGHFCANPQNVRFLQNSCTKRWVIISNCSSFQLSSISLENHHRKNYLYSKV